MKCFIRVVKRLYVVLIYGPLESRISIRHLLWWVCFDTRIILVCCYLLCDCLNIRDLIADSRCSVLMVDQMVTRDSNVLLGTQSIFIIKIVLEAENILPLTHFRRKKNNIFKWVSRTLPWEKTNYNRFNSLSRVMVMVVWHAAVDSRLRWVRSKGVVKQTVYTHSVLLWTVLHCVTY